MNFKKRVNGSWTDTSHYIHNTSTDIITTLPAVIYPTGTTATVGLKGQTTQSSIPSPTSPVMPQGTGDKTANLFDKTTLENGIYLAANGNKYGDITNGVRAGVKIKALPNTAYTLSAQSSANVSLRIFEWGNGTFIKQTPKYNISGNISLTVTTDAETTEIAFNIEGVNAQYATSIMLNTGSTALPYEPYGYKIPISSASTTTPVYLGEVQSTRQIRKVVLTGEEAWSEQTTNTFRVHDVINDAFCPANGSLGISNMYTQVPYGLINNMSDGQFTYGKPTGTYTRLAFKNTSCADVTAWKSYLQQQYANGTPVTVWCALATEKTAVVNEPLMKIGDYADEIINISVPTIIGTNTFNIDTVVQPSEVTLNYHGWHPIDNTHEHDNGEWN